MRLDRSNPCLRCIQAALEGKKDAAACRGPRMGQSCRRCRVQHKGIGQCLCASRGMRTKIRHLAERLRSRSALAKDPAVLKRGKRILHNARQALRASGLATSKGGPSTVQIMARLLEIVEDFATSFNKFLNASDKNHDRESIGSASSHSSEEDAEGDIIDITADEGDSDDNWEDKLEWKGFKEEADEGEQEIEMEFI